MLEFTFANGKKWSKEITPWEEIEATVRAMDEFTDEFLECSLLRFWKRKKLKNRIKECSEHIQKVCKSIPPPNYKE